MKSQGILSVRNLKKCYRERLVLDISNLCLERGGFYGLVGPNGAGKTTLLKILSFLERPSEGTIRFDGQPVNHSADGITALRRQVALVMQDPLLFHATVLRNVAYGLWVRGMNKQERYLQARQVLETVGLHDLADKPAHLLSGGEAQRVALARALAPRPGVLLLDEPMANLDRSNTALIEDTLRDINNRQGTTIVFTTHNLTQAQGLSKEVMALSAGRLTEMQEGDLRKAEGRE